MDNEPKKPLIADMLFGNEDEEMFGMDEPMTLGEEPAKSVSVARAEFTPFATTPDVHGNNNIDLLLDVVLRVTVELGRASMAIREVLALGAGSVIELDKLAGEPVDILVNGTPIAKGEVVVVDEKFGVRITDIVSPAKRMTAPL